MPRWIAAFLLFAFCATAAHAQDARKLLTGGGAKAWTPLNLSASLVAWWDAQYLPGLTFNVSNISAWTDRKSGIVASQGTGANQPAWSATARNGKPGATFAGAQNLPFGSNAVIPTGTSASFLAVAAFANTSGVASSATGYGVFTTAQLRAIQKSGSNVIVVTDFGTDITDGAWSNTDAFIEALYLSATVTGWVDGTANIGPSAMGFNTNGNAGAIGAAVTGNMFAGVVQQVLILNAAPSTCQRQKLEGWESWYDGKAGSNLPSNHPYKNAAPILDGAC